MLVIIKLLRVSCLGKLYMNKPGVQQAWIEFVLDSHILVVLPMGLVLDAFHTVAKMWRHPVHCAGKFSEHTRHMVSRFPNHALSLRTYTHYSCNNILLNLFTILSPWGWYGVIHDLWAPKAYKAWVITALSKLRPWLEWEDAIPLPDQTVPHITAELIKFFSTYGPPQVLHSAHLVK